MHTGKLWVPVHDKRGPWWAMAHPTRSVSLERAAKACNMSTSQFQNYELGWYMRKAYAIVIDEQEFDNGHD